MKKINILFLILISFTLSQTNLNAQITTIIDYSTFTNTFCNAFKQNANSLSSIVINGLIHKTTCGQPKSIVYSNNGNAENYILMETYFNNPYKISEYKIDFNFKQGYSYKITVNAKAQTPPNSFDPYCKLLLSFTGLNPSTIGNNCNGPEYYGIFSQVTSADNKQIGIGSYFDTEYNFNNLQNAQQAFFVNANVTDPSNTYGFYSYVQIKKITIVETAPPVIFNLSPGSVALQSGTSSSQTFTVNNVNNSPGVTGYEWNLGPTPNGWLYAGTPAPQFITITSNNLTLSSVACATTIRNINAVAKIGITSSYPTNTSVVTISNPTFTITGPSQLCTTAAQTYNLSPNNCNYNVIWSVSNPLVSYTPSLNSVSVSSNALVSGSFNLIATIAGAGGNVVITKPISVGPPALSNGVITTYNVLKCNVRGYKYTVPAIGATNYRWFSRNITQPTPFVQFKNSADNWATRGGDGSCDITEIKLEISNSCNTSTPEIIYISSDLCPPYLDGSCTYGRGIEVTSNTNQPTIQIKLIDEPNVKPALTQPRKIQQIRIVNKMGQAKKTLAGNKLEAMTLDISDLPMDVYTIMASDGKEWMSVQVAKK